MIHGRSIGEISLHATVVIYGESGVLIFGPSGSGKSALALALMARANGSGAFSALIGDDRVFVRKADRRLIAWGAGNMAGVIERRAVGLITVQPETAAVVRLAVELCDRGRRWPRMPEDDDGLIVGQIALPRITLNSSLSIWDQALVVEERLAVLTIGSSRAISNFA